MARHVTAPVKGNIDLVDVLKSTSSGYLGSTLKPPTCDANFLPEAEKRKLRMWHEAHDREYNQIGSGTSQKRRAPHAE